MALAASWQSYANPRSSGDAGQDCCQTKAIVAAAVVVVAVVAAVVAAAAAD